MRHLQLPLFAPVRNCPPPYAVDRDRGGWGLNLYILWGVDRRVGNFVHPQNGNSRSPVQFRSSQQFAADSPAEEAVTCGPVSAGPFPANRENYREIARISVSRRFDELVAPANRPLFAEFPAGKTGEFCDMYQGKDRREQGHKDKNGAPPVFVWVPCRFSPGSHLHGAAIGFDDVILLRNRGMTPAIPAHRPAERDVEV